ncbi:MAG TPA: HAD family hydrolase [Candidatus Limnocylindria bacterium]|nr:HAD family hydrolase [Candidatus Limnocylindria bacterium]
MFTEKADPSAEKLLSLGVLLDVDGTLVDSVYLHTIAWSRAFRRHAVEVPAWTIHRHIGMGGDHLVDAVAGAEVERGLGAAIRESRRDAFQEVIEEVRPIPGALRLLRALQEAGMRVSLATSAEPDEMDHYRMLLGGDDLVGRVTDSSDVDRTKPDPDLIDRALETIGGHPAVMVGDSTWDCVSAERAGVPTIGVLTGGFSRDELLDAGAEAVAEDLDELQRMLEARHLSGLAGRR